MKPVLRPDARVRKAVRDKAWLHSQALSGSLALLGMERDATAGPGPHEGGLHGFRHDKRRFARGAVPKPKGREPFHHPAFGW